MINLELHELKMLNAQLAEGTIGIDRPELEGPAAWDSLGGYTQGLSPDRQWSLTHVTEQRALAWIAERLAKNSLVVEVGSFLGCSAAIMAHANPNIQIKSIDIFDTLDDSQRSPMQAYYDEIKRDTIESFLGPNRRRTRDAVAERLKHYPNIEFLSGDSPGDFRESDINFIDLYFEDAQHNDPGLAANLDFWTTRVRYGGLVMLHDYRPWLPLHYSQREEQLPKRFPDVEGHVRRLMGLGWTVVGRISGLVILRRPHPKTSLVG